MVKLVSAGRLYPEDSVYEVVVEDEYRNGLLTYPVGGDEKCHIAGLCPTTKYHIGVRTKAAKDSDELWSPATFVSYITELYAPPSGPKFVKNALDVEYDDNDTMKVLLYWDLANTCRDSKGMRNVIYQYSDTTLVQKRELRADVNFTIFTGINSNNGYKFVIFSENEAGRSAKGSEIYVHPKYMVPTTPSNISLKYIQESNAYQLEWQPSLPIRSSQGYLVTWCRNSDIVYGPMTHCLGSLKFQRVAGSVSSFIHGDPGTHDLQFGVATVVTDGKEILSSGFRWTSSEYTSVYKAYVTNYRYVFAIFLYCMEYATYIIFLLLFTHICDELCTFLAESEACVVAPPVSTGRKIRLKPTLNISRSTIARPTAVKPQAPLPRLSLADILKDIPNARVYTSFSQCWKLSEQLTTGQLDVEDNSRETEKESQTFFRVYM
ncbi:hypothetical protein HDE_07859 [Halotydeus destructor]|nr:hypothetical protein HDE_07859 [Halotydeus destructor]